ncbi:MAG: SGNH/GDSL hydrolase family protein, partial [Planctomycetota bacterium]
MGEKTDLFVIGDSISIGYGPFLKAMTAAHFNYARKSGEEEALKNLDIPAGANGGNSAKVLAYLEALAASKSFATDILLINCGLHDLNQNR